jgi:hypothetical protein
MSLLITNFLYMGVPINYWALLVAAVIQIVLGFLWYGPLFGKPWMKMMGFTRESMEKAKAKGMTTSYIVMLVSTFIMTYVLAHAIVFGSEYTNMYGATAGMTAAFWYWLGFVAPVTLGSVLWEGKSWKLWMLNAGYYLVALLISGGILAHWVA